MKRYLIFVFWTLFFPIEGIAAPIVGQAVPSFFATDLEGEVINSEHYAGKIIVLEWRATECPYTQRVYGDGTIQSLQQFAAEQGVVWLSIDSTAPGEPGYQEERNYQHTLESLGAKPTAMIVDKTGGLARAFGARTTPHIFIIGPSGNLVYSGAVNNDAVAPMGKEHRTTVNYVEMALKNLLANQPVQTPITRSYGCAIKRASVGAN